MNNQNQLIKLIYEYRKPLIVLSVLAIITSSIVSLLIDNKYESTLIMYPISISSASSGLLSDESNSDYLKFGGDVQVDQMLQILNSQEIQNHIISKYNLINHYEIDTAKRFYKTELNKKIKDNITFSRTQYMSVKVNVLDKDPIIAADIANDIGNLYDSVRIRISNTFANKALSIVENNYLNHKKHIKSIEDGLNEVAKHGVNEYEIQVGWVTESISRAMVVGKEKVVKRLENKLEEMGKYGSKFLSLKSRLEESNQYLTAAYGIYQKIAADLNSEMKYKFIVNKALPSDKKSYPIRWLIVLVSTVSTFLTALIFILIRKSFQLKVNEQD